MGSPGRTSWVRSSSRVQRYPPEISRPSGPTTFKARAVSDSDPGSAWGCTVTVTAFAADAVAPESSDATKSKGSAPVVPLDA